jgi:hypothetical protein
VTWLTEEDFSVLSKEELVAHYRQLRSRASEIGDTVRSIEREGCALALESLIEMHERATPSRKIHADALREAVRETRNRV